MMSFVTKAVVSSMKTLDSNFKIALPFIKPKFPLDSEV